MVPRKCLLSFENHLALTRLPEVADSTPVLYLESDMKRSERRHQQQRVKSKVLKTAAKNFGNLDTAFESKSHQKRWVGKMVSTHGKPCSCPYCANKREVEGETRQEKLAALKQREGEKEAVIRAEEIIPEPKHWLDMTVREILQEFHTGGIGGMKYTRIGKGPAEPGMPEEYAFIIGIGGDAKRIARCMKR